MNPKKTVARAAALALLGLAAGHAQAQLDYSAYGVLDLSYGRFEPSGQLPENRWNSNSLTATFVGVNAKYGFDGGWAPGITLETFLRFQDRDTGRNDRDPLLSRNAFVSLDSPYGRLRVGRLQTFLFDATVRFNAMGNSVAFSPAVRHVFAAGNLVGVQGDFYWNRAASWQSPSYEGISGSVMVRNVRARLARKVWDASSMEGEMPSTTPMRTRKAVGVKLNVCASHTPWKP